MERFSWKLKRVSRRQIGIMERWNNGRMGKKMKNISNSLNPIFRYSIIPIFLLEE
jgi:hypothetical protein